jgi:hypothetical protein
VTWKDHTELPKTTGPLQIRFVLRDASLYSFAAGDGVEVLSFDSGVLYTFEGDNSDPKTVPNRLFSNGEQDGRLLHDVEVVHNNSAFGKSVLWIKGGGTTKKPNVVEIPGTTNLGTTFTLSAMVKMTNAKLTRIFSSYDSTASDKIGSYDVLFDVDPSGSAFKRGDAVLRAAIFGTSITSLRDRVKIKPDDGYHHFAMTYAKGNVTLYFDGQEVGSGPVSQAGGAVYSYYDLRVGHVWGWGVVLPAARGIRR